MTSAFESIQHLVPSRPIKPFLIVGDSVSAGVGVEASKSYPAILERRLKGHRIINTSVPGYNLTDYLNVLRATFPAITVEGIIVGLCLNDVAEASQLHILQAIGESQEHRGESAPRIEPSHEKYPNPIVRALRYLNDNYVHFNDVLKHYSRSYLWIKSLATDTSRDYFTADASAYRDPHISEILRQQLDELHHLAQRHHVWLVLLIFPYEYQLRVQPDGTGQPQQLITEVARQAGVSVYNLAEDLRTRIEKAGIQSKALYLFNDPVHFSAEGHRMLAELVSQWLTDNRRLDHGAE